MRWVGLDEQWLGALRGKVSNAPLLLLVDHTAGAACGCWTRWSEGLTLRRLPEGVGVRRMAGGGGGVVVGGGGLRAHPGCSSGVCTCGCG